MISKDNLKLKNKHDFWVFASLCQFPPVFAGINRHKLVFATDWHKLSLRLHFANPDSSITVTTVVLL